MHHLIAVPVKHNVEFKLEGHASANVPFVVPLHRPAIEDPPLEAPDIAQEGNFGHRLGIDVRGRIAVVQDCFLVIAQHDVEGVVAPQYRRQLDRLRRNRLPRPAKRGWHVLKGHVADIVRPLVLRFQIDHRIARQLFEVPPEEGKEGLVRDVVASFIRDRF